MVEVPLVRQMVETVVEAGPEGILHMDVFKRLGLSTKHYQQLFMDVVRKYGLQVGRRFILELLCMAQKPITMG